MLVVLLIGILETVVPGVLLIRLASRHCCTRTVRVQQWRLASLAPHRDPGDRIRSASHRDKIRVPGMLLMGILEIGVLGVLLIGVLIGHIH